MCKSVTVLCATQHYSSAWASFAPKLTTTLTVTETKTPVLAHVVFLRRVLTNPSEHGDSIVQRDCGVHFLADVFNACSAEPQSPPNSWMERSTLLSLGTSWPSKSTNSELLSIKAKTRPQSLHNTDVSDESWPPHHSPSPPQQRHQAANQFFKKSKF